MRKGEGKRAASGLLLHLLLLHLLLHELLHLLLLHLLLPFPLPAFDFFELFPLLFSENRINFGLENHTVCGDFTGQLTQFSGFLTDGGLIITRSNQFLQIFLHLLGFKLQLFDFRTDFIDHRADFADLLFTEIQHLRELVDLVGGVLPARHLTGNREGET